MIDIMHWQLLNERPAHWQLDEQTLSVQVSQGNIWGYGNAPVNNLFLLPIESEEIAAQVTVELTPQRSYEQAGVALYWDDNNYIKISKEMFNGRLSLVFVVEAAGRPSIEGITDFNDSAVRLSITKQGSEVSVHYSPTTEQHNAEWQTLGKTQSLAGKPQGVMLYTFGGSGRGDNTAQFSEFAY
ncbi:DUF1349 domain-containing protein [Aliagarivorans marinus]|uniref:DUF1349 domain-containing protein n=1 Tax=Aliagarivorans marinus TaxID=561965 RepID=UPI0003F89D9A|nr:DUF1349 domain-containing protein [Aliagarivorans marinus]